MNLSYRIGHTIFRAVARSFYDFRVIGEENLNQTGPALIVANHVSFLDPPFIGQAFDEPLYFFARKSLFDHPMAGKLLRSWQTIPVDRDKPDASSLKSTIRLLRSGKKVLMFPEGTRSFDGLPQKAEAGVGLFIAKSSAPVLPVRIFGSYEAYPRGAKFLRPAQIRLVVGKPYHPDLKAHSAAGRDLYQALADEVMERISELTL
ncbi:1-acyl-sn-glycerol-3-phosphate acyltransferase [Prosthecobacter fusiformis]|uniref:1-acyl-sn-glycerol-3-phosphate acyltransferase n=1 Tax=Prosthecobacter fusiformis TaxID=48464 RepID=A0A4R7SRU8_9BACT|nr:lysophospholipid acyltransferase family protein [Prosthecobacter fusiformis]TDU81196.1 1-acyl-sn-glycerol-3-phosphate acyltransferase [Prosthecobacter fusiformis]